MGSDRYPRWRNHYCGRGRLMNRGLCLFVLLLSLSVGGCALNPNSTISVFAHSSGSNSFEVLDRRVSPAALVLPVEHDRQTRGPSCGAHALASVVNYWRGPA